MLEKIKEALKNAGLPEDMAKLVHVTQESEIEGAVGELKKYFGNELQKEGDKRATEATKTALQNFKKKLGLDPETPDEKVKEMIGGTQGSGGSPGSQPQAGQNTGQNNGQNTGQGEGGGQGNGQGSPNSQNNEVAQLKEQINQVTQQLNQLVTEKQTTQRKQDFVNKLTEKEIPENSAKQLAETVNFENLDSDDKLNQQADQIKKTFDEYKKEVIKTEVGETTQPGSPQQPEDVDKAVAEHAKERWQNAEEGEGKNL